MGLTINQKKQKTFPLRLPALKLAHSTVYADAEVAAKKAAKEFKPYANAAIAKLVGLFEVESRKVEGRKVEVRERRLSASKVIRSPFFQPQPKKNKKTKQIDARLPLLAAHPGRHHPLLLGTRVELPADRGAGRDEGEEDCSGD